MPLLDFACCCISLTRSRANSICMTCTAFVLSSGPPMKVSGASRRLSLVVVMPEEVSMVFAMSEAMRLVEWV